VDGQPLLRISKTPKVKDPFYTDIFGREPKVASDYDVTLPIVRCIRQTMDEVVGRPNTLHSWRQRFRSQGIPFHNLHLIGP
jgi:hypothetical protein